MLELSTAFFSHSREIAISGGFGFVLPLLMWALLLIPIFRSKAKRISISASYGVRDLCIGQSRAQLRSACGDNDAQNFITNHGEQIVFAPREQSDATEYSEMLGYKTIRKRHQSRSSGGGQRSTVSVNYTEEKRALFLPQEIKELPADDELIFYEGCKPIRAKKNWFFKDSNFRKRANIEPAKIARVQPALLREVVTNVVEAKSDRAAAALRQ
jgi:type IV secretion system protein VirD4